MLGNWNLFQLEVSAEDKKITEIFMDSKVADNGCMGEDLYDWMEQIIPSFAVSDYLYEGGSDHVAVISSTGDLPDYALKFVPYLLAEFVQTSRFQDLLQVHIIDAGGSEGMHCGDKFLIVSSWSSTENMEAAVRNCIADEEGYDVECTNIDFDSIIAEYLGSNSNWGFDDEYAQATGGCYDIVKLTPDSYGSMPDWVRDAEYGEIFCGKCMQDKSNQDWYVEELRNDADRCNNVLSTCSLETHGYKRHDEKFETGLHLGMNDSPKDQLAKWNKQGYDVIFNKVENSQFYSVWEVWLKPIEVACLVCGAEGTLLDNGWDGAKGMCGDCAEGDK